MIVQFIMPMFLTRYLAKSDYGIYCQFYLWLALLGSILGFGIQSNLYYFFPKSTEERQNSIIWNSIFCSSFMGLICVLFFLIPGTKELIFNNGEIDNFVTCLVIGIAFYIPSNIIAPLATVRKDKIITMTYPVADILLKVLLVIGFALTFGSIKAILWSVTILQLCQIIFLLGYVGKHYKPNKNSFDFSLLKEQLSYAFPFGIAVILNTICGRVDKVMCVSNLTTEEYATYALAFFGIPGIMQVYDSLCQVNVVNMSQAFKSGNKMQVSTLYKQFVQQTLSFSVPIIFIVILFSPQIIVTLFSEKYADSVPFFQLYILTFIFGMLGCGTILRAVNRTRMSMWAYLIASVICIPTALMLIRNYGIWGAITSAMINTLLPKFIQIGFEIKLMKMAIHDYLPWGKIMKIFTIATATIIPFIVLSVFYELNFVTCVFLGALYIIIAYWLEIRYNVFLLKSDAVRSYINKIKNKIGGKPSAK